MLLSNLESIAASNFTNFLKSSGYRKKKYVGKTCGTDELQMSKKKQKQTYRHYTQLDGWELLVKDSRWCMCTWQVHMVVAAQYKRTHRPHG